MNTSNVIRASKLNAVPASAISIKSRASSAWHTLTHGLFAEEVVGSPLHEAWSADGQPLERMSPNEMVKASALRYLIVPHSRSR